MRRTLCRRWNGFTGANYYGPAPYLPDEYMGRLANKRMYEMDKPTDPKFCVGAWEKSIGYVHPGLLGVGSSDANVAWSQSGPMADIPPVPVYRKYTFCNGHFSTNWAHPRIHIKVLPGSISICKWCRTKFVNMSSDEDTDENWEEEEHAIAVTPEKLEDLMAPRRDAAGVVISPFVKEGPHPEAHKSVFNPEKYKWRMVDETGKLMPPRKNKEAQISEGEAKINE